MAEDLLIGFDFAEREDNFNKDVAAQAESDILFTEFGFDQLRGDTAPAHDTTGAPESAERSGEVGSFDFTEAFDFIL